MFDHDNRIAVLRHHISGVDVKGVPADNELVFAVTEGFGGWGVVARLGSLDGIEVSRTTP